MVLCHTEFCAVPPRPCAIHLQPPVLLAMLIKGAHSEPLDWVWLSKGKLTTRISKRNREVDHSTCATCWKWHRVNPCGLAAASTQVWRLFLHEGPVRGRRWDSAFESISSLTWGSGWWLRVAPACPSLRENQAVYWPNQPVNSLAIAVCIWPLSSASSVPADILIGPLDPALFGLSAQFCVHGPLSSPCLLGILLYSQRFLMLKRSL